MYFKNLLTKSLLVAAVLGVGASNSWAGVSTYDFQNYAKGLATKATIGLTLGSSPGKVNNTAVYTISDVNDATFGEFVFDGKFAAQNTDITFRRGGGTQGSADGYAGLQNTSNARYFAVLNLAVGDQIVFNTTDGGNGGLKFVTTNVTYDNSGTPSTPAQWDAVTSGTTYTVTTAGTLGLQLQKLGYINSITITSSSETVSAPTISITAANGTSRTVSITGGTSDEGNTVKTYYTIDGSDPSASSSEYSAPFVLSDASYTVKAITISSASTASDITSLTVDATSTLPLEAPVISLTVFTENVSVFNPTYSFTSDQSSVIGAPTATLTYSFNGGAATAGTSYTPTETGTLRVTASAEGYASTYTELPITCAEFIKSYSFDAINDVTVDPTDDSLWGSATNVGGTQWTMTSLTNCTYNLREDIVLSSQFSYARTTTAKKKQGFYTRSGAGSISYSINPNDYIQFTLNGSYLCANGSTTSKSIAWYTNVRAIDIFSPASITVEVSAAGMATYVSDYNLDFTGKTLKAYKVTVASKGVATLKELGEVPAGTPILLIGATEDIPVVASATDANANDLVAGTGAAVATTDGDYTNMILNNIDSKVGFYFAAGQTVAANRAYLHFNKDYAPDPVAGARMTLVFADGETTGVEAIENSQLTIDNSVYDLQGRRVANPTRGLYIVNGRKVVVK